MHLEEFGGLRKLMNKADRVAAISITLVSFLAIITHPITRLHTVCESVFEKDIFGVHVMKWVLQELHKNRIYIYDEQKLQFAPWKILRAIVMSAVGD